MQIEEALVCRDSMTVSGKGTEMTVYRDVAHLTGGGRATRKEEIHQMIMDQVSIISDQ